MVSTNEDHWGVGFTRSTDEGSNDAGGKEWTVRSFCRQNIEGTGGNGLWKKRKQK